MKIRIASLLLPVLLLSAGIGFSEAGMNEVRQVEDAIAIIREFTKIPENEIPPLLLRNAEAIAVFPGALKIGFIFAGAYGQGVISVRDKNRYWSNPVFIKVIGGSVGYQIGVQSADIILVFKSLRSIHDITAGKFSFGPDSAVAIGPVGRRVSAGTDIGFNSEIYSYSRASGLFAGMSIQGSALEIDYESIVGFYGNTQIGARDIFETPDLNAPKEAADFRQALAEQTR
jgi:lipid-binding SYLF domain-containing protein